MDKIDWDERLKIVTWPECSDAGPKMEGLYQAIKKRLMTDLLKELAGKTEYDYWLDDPKLNNTGEE